MKLKGKLSRRVFSGCIGMLIVLAVGLSLFSFRIGGNLTRFSFDVPFITAPDRDASEVVIVYMDEDSQDELHQPPDASWSRHLHATLLERLKSEGVRLVVFDLFFKRPSSSEEDQHLAQAIRSHGNIVLLGQHRTIKGAGVAGRQPDEPYRLFLDAADGRWGTGVVPYDPDFGARRLVSHWDGTPQIIWASVQAIKKAAAQPPPGWAKTHWINYYGPPGTLKHVSYYQALDTNLVQPGFFTNKIVFIGAKQSSDYSGKGKDEFATPFSRWGVSYSPGTEVHATAFLNLLHSDWLERLNPTLEIALLILVSVLAGSGLVMLTPKWAVAAALGAIAVIMSGAHFSAWHAHTWFAWGIVVIQVLFALAWAIVYNSTRAYIDKRLLEQSMAVHFSPARVQQILREPGSLKPGAVRQEVSILFSDIAGFSKVSQRLDPDDLVSLLNSYYENAIACIHATDGTVMDLIGDAIFAIWNAPAPQPDHQQRACRAALALHDRLLHFDETQRSLPLRTRVGLHTDMVCVGNVGSSTRFDYTAIGDAVNLASRLEGLNKHLGTEILATREIQRSIENQIVSRLVGHFKFKGFDRVVEVHELIGPMEQRSSSEPWRAEFAAGLHHFQRRDFDVAEKHFRRTLELRSGDGPSKFYIEQIEQHRREPPDAEWAGEVDMKSK